MAVAQQTWTTNAISPSMMIVALRLHVIVANASTLPKSKTVYW